MVDGAVTNKLRVAANVDVPRRVLQIDDEEAERAVRDQVVPALALQCGVHSPRWVPAPSCVISTTNPRISR
jgi:hypothetical protein